MKFHTRGDGALNYSLYKCLQYVLDGRVFKMLVPHPHIDQKI